MTAYLRSLSILHPPSPHLPYRQGWAEKARGEGVCTCMLGANLKSGLLKMIEVPHWKPINCNNSFLCVEECEAEVMFSPSSDIARIEEKQLILR